MERSEPTLVPEWLRVTGSVGGAGNSAHQVLHSDVLSPSHLRNRCARNVSDSDTCGSAFLNRTSSSSRRSSSSNSSSKHPYGSFSRTHRDNNRDKEKERSVIEELWDHDGSDPLDCILISRAEKDTLRRSHSLVCRKPGEVLPRKAVDSKNGGSSNGVLSRGNIVSSTQKNAFEKDFPSLGVGEKQGLPDVGRVTSPGLGAAVQCLPFGNPGLIGGEGWTSALAEVPTIIGSNNMGAISVQQSVVATPPSGASSPMASLNMAEALSQAPSRARTTPQLPDKTHRREELAVKQSRQLIPMTPLMPKGLVLSSDKSKTKTAVRANEMIVAAKTAQQQSHSSQLANHPRGGQVRSDSPRSSNAGKFLVLKPVWENGASSASPMPPCTALKSPNSSNLSSIQRKMVSLSLNSGSAVEKRSSHSQARSRNEFFNHMRKKSSPNTSTVLPDSGVTVSSPTSEKSGETVEEPSAPVSLCVTENGSEVISNEDDTHEGEKKLFLNGGDDTHEGDKNLFLNEAVYPDEEEAAFLRSLGWEENDGEDDGLTEEEINAFYEEYMKLRPSLKLCRGVQPKLSMLSESHMTASSRSSSELSLSSET
ncbi:hypothetical protein U1Q18_016568 [Sarracenia purpurea var. burkii]